MLTMINAENMHPQTGSSRTNINLNTEYGICGFFTRMEIPTCQCEIDIFSTCLKLIPVKNLSSHLTRCELTWKLTPSSFWDHSSSSQWTHKIVSLLWALFEFVTHTVSLLWTICEIIRWAHRTVVAVSSLWELQNSWKAHSKLTLRVHLVSPLWANWVSSKWAHSEIIQVSFLWVWC